MIYERTVHVMSRDETIKILKKEAEEYKADFVSEKYFDEIIPAAQKEFYSEDVESYKEILGHELACLKEFIDLAENALIDLTMNPAYRLKIVHDEFCVL